MFEKDLQTAIYAALTSNSALMSEITGVYDHVPQKTQYPFVVIGDDDHTQFGADGYHGSTALINIDVWSQYHGKSEVKNLFGLIYSALHNNDNLPAPIDFIVWESSNIIKDRDGKTWHGISTFKVVMIGLF